jgi:lactoylglutathione lyase
MMKLLYTGIRVRDLEKSIQFYRKVMGMKTSRRGKMHHGGIWVELKSPGSPQRLELNWYPPGSRFYTKYRKGEELDHVAFRVTDVDRSFREVTAKGARPEVEPFKESRYAFAFISDPDGIWIELLGRVRA